MADNLGIELFVLLMSGSGITSIYLCDIKSYWQVILEKKNYSLGTKFKLYLNRQQIHHELNVDPTNSYQMRSISMLTQNCFLCWESVVDGGQTLGKK